MLVQASTLGLVKELVSNGSASGASVLCPVPCVKGKKNSQPLTHLFPANPVSRPLPRRTDGADCGPALPGSPGGSRGPSSSGGRLLDDAGSNSGVLLRGSVDAHVGTHTRYCSELYCRGECVFSYLLRMAMWPNGQPDLEAVLYPDVPYDCMRLFKVQYVFLLLLISVTFLMQFSAPSGFQICILMTYHI